MHSFPLHTAQTTEVAFFTWHGTQEVLVSSNRALKFVFSRLLLSLKCSRGLLVTYASWIQERSLHVRVIQFTEFMAFHDPTDTPSLANASSDHVDTGCGLSCLSPSLPVDCSPADGTPYPPRRAAYGSISPHPCTFARSHSDCSYTPENKEKIRWRNIHWFCSL